MLNFLRRGLHQQLRAKLCLARGSVKFGFSESASRSRPGGNSDQSEAKSETGSNKKSDQDEDKKYSPYQEGEIKKLQKQI